MNRIKRTTETTGDFDMPRSHLFLTASLIALLTGSALAGPLTPPSGAPSSTGKTLTEVEPRIVLSQANTPGDASSVFRILQPGSYYLTGDITVESGQTGIAIIASNVTIDLNGFTITGQAGASTGVRNVLTTLQRNTVRNGRVIGFVVGVNLSSGSSTVAAAHRVEDLVVQDCAADGIAISDGSVRNCHVARNETGISVGSVASIVENCTANDNRSIGIWVGNGTVRNCSASGNVTGIRLASGTISQCTANANSTGLYSEAGSVIDSVAHGNTSVGIFVIGSCLVRGNTVSADQLANNTTGIQASGSVIGARIEGNAISRMATGIVCTTSNNLIIQNSFRGCTRAIDAVSGNRVGTLLVGNISPAILGNNGGGLGTTDPFANIVH